MGPWGMDTPYTWLFNFLLTSVGKTYQTCCSETSISGIDSQISSITSCYVSSIFRHERHSVATSSLANSHDLVTFWCYAQLNWSMTGVQRLFINLCLCHVLPETDTGICISITLLKKYLAWKDKTNDKYKYTTFKTLQFLKTAASVN